MCVCSKTDAQSVSHILLKCPLYSQWQSELIHQLLSLINFTEDNEIEIFCLNDPYPGVLKAGAMLLLIAFAYRNQLVPSMNY